MSSVSVSNGWFALVLSAVWWLFFIGGSCHWRFCVCIISTSLYSGSLFVFTGGSSHMVMWLSCVCVVMFMFMLVWLPTVTVSVWFPSLTCILLSGCCGSPFIVMGLKG